jgi:AraC family transcriptional regulator, ethanolamine operon transcriptional activator
VIHRVFTDFDEFRATNPQVEGQWLIRDGKDFRWTTDSLRVGECHIVRCFLNTSVITEGRADDDFYQFYVPFKSNVWRNNGVEFNDDAFLIVEPGAEYFDVTNAADGWHGFMVPKHLLAISPETRGERSRRSYTIHGEKRRADFVRDLFRRVIAEVAENPAIESSVAAQMVEVEMRTALEPLLALDVDNPQKLGRPPISRSEIISRSQSIFEEFADRPLHVSQLADLVDVSERCLRIAFNDVYQIGPRQYLRLRQLHEVRQELIAADRSERTVTDVLTRWGVWEFGRFAGRYKEHFGELPSETLLRQRP